MFCDVCIFFENAPPFSKMAEIQNDLCDTTKPQVLPKHYLQLLQEKRDKELLQASQSTSTIPVSSGDVVQGDTCDFPVNDFEKLKINETPQCHTTECTTQNDSNVTTTVNKQSQSVLDYYGDTNPYEDTSIKSEFDYVLEVYGFKSFLKTKDILQELFKYGSNNMKLKWVDDTHALAIYSNSLDAVTASKGPYTIIKVKFLTKCSHKESLAIASQVAASIKESLIHKDRNSSIQRPKTTSTVARRMVGHALGIKINVSPEQRQKEHTQIQLAKEEKREKKKQITA